MAKQAFASSYPIQKWPLLYQNLPGPLHCVVCPVGKSQHLQHGSEPQGGSPPCQQQPSNALPVRVLVRPESSERMRHLPTWACAVPSSTKPFALTYGNSRLEYRGSALIERNWTPGSTLTSTGPSLKRKVPRAMITPAASAKEKKHGAKNH